jgi:hypothetical protein
MGWWAFCDPHIGHSSSDARTYWAGNKNRAAPKRSKQGFDIAPMHGLRCERTSWHSNHHGVTMTLNDLITRINQGTYDVIKVERNRLVTGNTDREGNYDIVKLTLGEGSDAESVHFNNSSGAWVFGSLRK